MDIAAVLNEKCIELNLKARNKEEAIRELTDLLSEQGLITDQEEFFTAVQEREKLFSTGIGMGIAIPHGKSPAVRQAAVAFGRSANGVDFNSMDDKPAHLIFLLAVPEDANDLHLQVLSTLSRLLMHKEVREALSKATSAAEVVAAFKTGAENE